MFLALFSWEKKDENILYSPQHYVNVLIFSHKIVLKTKRKKMNVLKM